MRDLFSILTARLMSARLPIDQGALVHTQDLEAFNSRHLEVEPALLDLLTDVLRIGWIFVRFP